MEVKLQLQVFLVLIVKLTGSLAEQSQLICSHQPIVAVVDDDVILPCHLEPPINIRSQIVVWTRPGLDPEYVHYHEDGRLNRYNQNPSYHYRTRLFVDELMNGNVSILILKVKRSDEGEYKCSLPSMLKEASIQLTVDVPDVIGSHEPVKATVGEDVILPCHLEPPFNVSTLTVEWMQNGTVVHHYRSGSDHQVEQHKNFKDRTSLFHDEMKKGNISLKLTNVTEQDVGRYTCYVPKLHSQVKRGNVTLIVESGDDGKNGSRSDDPSDGPGPSPGNSTEVIAGIAVSAVIVSAVIAVIAVIVWKCRKTAERRRRQENREDANQETSVPLNDLRDNADDRS